MSASRLPALLQGFFTERLLGQLGASHHTVAGYRDAFRVPLGFAADRLGRAPSPLHVSDLDAAFLGRFLDHLEQARGNGARARSSASSP